MKFHWTSSNKRWKDSLTVSLAILTTLQTIAEISGLFDIQSIETLSWWLKLIIILLIFVLLTVLVFGIKNSIAMKGIMQMVGDNMVKIKQQDIFTHSGLKVIPFNEYFDTQVDDVVIAHNTLNGIFIDSHVDDIIDLKTAIENATNVKSLNARLINGRNKYQLGRIIRYRDYLLLAFTHFNDNNSAYLSHTEYEECLIRMWKEIDRLYANIPVCIPLLGSGITRFTDTPHKDNKSLLRCLLCTLKMSGVHFKRPITICITKETMEEINIYELKSE